LFSSPLNVCVSLYRLESVGYKNGEGGWKKKKKKKKKIESISKRAVFIPPLPPSP